MSGVAKSTREWCIRMAAIVIVTIAGIWNFSAPIDSKYVTILVGTNIRSDVQWNGRQ